MIASLPMYDWPEVRAATDAFWKGLSRRLPERPALERGMALEVQWRRPELLFSQTCGYPFTHEFRGQLTYVGTPHYAVDGCRGANYCSIVIAREAMPPAALRGSAAAVNNPDSMSGMLALKLVFAPLAKSQEFFNRTHWSGSHVNSLEAVRQGKADVCAIDAVCVGLARRHRPELLQGLVEIARSPSVPGLPFVTRALPPEEIRAALAKAFADPELARARDVLLLTGVSNLGAAAYDQILDLERAMEAQGGLRLS